MGEVIFWYCELKRFEMSYPKIYGMNVTAITLAWYHAGVTFTPHVGEGGGTQRLCGVHVTAITLALYHAGVTFTPLTMHVWVGHVVPRTHSD